VVSAGIRLVFLFSRFGFEFAGVNPNPNLEKRKTSLIPALTTKTLKANLI
jgi:hypothetical protein